MHDIDSIDLSRFGEILVASVPSAPATALTDARIGRHPDAPGKQRSWASICVYYIYRDGTAIATAVSVHHVRLNSIDLNRFGEILGA
jgi:hypothetical protein